jgi:Rap1a immunity proteins
MIQSCLRIAVTCAVTVLCIPAFGSEVTGENLYNICTSQNINSQSLCGSYLLGVWDGLVLAGDLGGPYAVCPNSARAPGAAALRLVFVSWARRYPEFLTRLRSDTAAASLSEAFPCTPRRR